jgi:hypothetical protein
MVPGKIAKQNLTYNQLRQAIQRIILEERRGDSVIVTTSDVDLFIKTYLINSTK